ncbi:oxidoreductase-like [hydrothermal vent metagenome]|uniref:Oxidoreductase-like n=1 Tax=hydrothermal vent metagenome TaxID=652676 RepID=A0A3B1DXM9_9ZZZZ
MIRIGIIGLGFMGYTHYSASHNLRGAKVTAIATRNKKKRAGDWTSIQGNFGPRGGHVDLSKVKTYENYHDLLADPDIDVVDICLPTDQHETVVLDAIKAGKNILVEKPISVDLKSANRMVNAAKKAGVQLMVAHVLPFFPEFQFVADAIAKEKYGKLQAAHFRRVIAPPKWSKGMEDYRKLGGWGIDLHIHDNHFICATCGVPQKVFSQGIQREGLVNHIHSNYLFDDVDLAVSSVSGGIAPKEMQFAHGFEMIFEKGMIIYNAGTIAGEWVVDRPLTLIAGNSKPRQPKLKGGSEWYSAFTLELQEMVNSLKSGKKSKLLSGELARDALKLCFAESKSIAGRKLVKV